MKKTEKKCCFKKCPICHETVLIKMYRYHKEICDIEQKYYKGLNNEE